MTITVPTEDQLSLSRGVAEFFAGNYPIDRFRTARDNAMQADTIRWRDLAAMGVLGISLSEADGGMGLSWLDEALACREAGRYLLSPAVVGSIFAARLAAQAGNAELRDALLQGECRAGIAMSVGGEVRVVDGGEGLFVLIQDDRLALVEPGESNMLALHCIDDTVQLLKAEIRAQQPDWIADRNLVLGAHLLLAAMLCGLLETTCEMAAGYARTRVQFGRPIGAFQAIKHRCADIALATELCWSQTLQAVEALQSGAADAEFQVLTAKLLAGEEALKAARFNIQAHGGMGFTDEVDAHRLMKRAHVLHQLLDDPRLVCARLLTLDMTLEA
jgi:alkylation response protein AidB-like acyl-CoA dehydrogenase